MTQFKGVIGKWFLDHSSEVCAVLDGRAVVVIATVNPMAELTAEAAEAHGRLIASAPALLEALRKSAEGWANAIDLGLLPPQHVPAAEVLRDEARAAIRQATGEGE